MGLLLNKLSSNVTQTQSNLSLGIKLGYASVGYLVYRIKNLRSQSRINNQKTTQQYIERGGKIRKLNKSKKMNKSKKLKKSKKRKTRHSKKSNTNTKKNKNTTRR